MEACLDGESNVLQYNRRKRQGIVGNDYLQASPDPLNMYGTSERLHVIYTQLNSAM